MKVVETKIYLILISWFVAVSLLSLAALFLAVYIYNPEVIIGINFSLKQAILFALFISLALVLLVSLVVTRYLAKKITSPVFMSLEEMSKVVSELSKSVQSLSDISQNNSELSQFLLESSQKQQKGLKSGYQAVSDILKSLVKVARKTKSAAKKTSDIDVLAGQGQAKAQEAISSLVAVKHLVTENQKLSHALDNYAKGVKDIAGRMSALAETARFLSLNVSIEASKQSFSEDFSTLVSQIRELNISSQEAAVSVDSLATDMQRQIEQSHQSSVYQWEETTKSIKVVSQTIKFLSKIVGDITQVAQSVKVIDKETQETRQDADDINQMISKLQQEARALVKHVDNITQIIRQQMVVTRSLNRSSAGLTNVTDSLNNLLGRDK